MATNELNHGELLKEWVHFLRLKPKILLERLNYENHDNLYHWYGKSEIKMSVLQKWAAAFHVSLEQLLAGPHNAVKHESALNESSPISYQLHHGQRLSALVEEKQANISALAKKLDVTRPTLYAMFEKDVLSGETLKKLAEFFNVPVTYFTGGGPTRGYYEQNENDLVRQIELMLNKKMSENLAAIEVLIKKHCAAGK